MVTKRRKVKVAGKGRAARRMLTRPLPITALAPVQAVQIVAGGEIADGEATTAQTKYTVPVGKRLHIEYVWMGGWAPDEQVLRVGLTCIVNRVIGNFGFHTMPVATTPQFRSDGDASFPVSLYADAGTDVTVWGNRTGGYSGQAFVEAILSGQLLPA
jgi:hypothetical protein